MTTITGGMNSVSDEMLEAMNITREFLDYRDIEKEQMDATAPDVGSQAPDFIAERLTLEGERNNSTIKFSNLFNKPVGLIFGSYTCPIFRGQLKRYEEIHQSLKNQINFLCVYILEAHPEDGWRVPHNWEKNVCITTPQNMDDRATIARRCIVEEGLTIPIVLDTMENDLLKLYAGSPERLYVIDTGGLVAHKSSIGPFDDDDVEAWSEKLRVLA